MLRAYSILLLAILPASGLCRGDEGMIHPGDVVIVKADTPLKKSGRVVGQVRRNDMREVREIRGAWADIGEKDAGWIRISSLLRGQEAREYLEKNSADPSARLTLLLALARMDIRDENFEEADEKLREAEKLDPNRSDTQYLLGLIAKEQDDVDQALQRFSAAIRLNPDDLKSYRERIAINVSRNRSDLLIVDLEQVSRRGEATAMELNQVAWRLATDPDATVRNGTKAVKYALAACEQTNYEDYRIVDTLAAAYAEAGDFQKAEQWQEEAVELASDYFEKQDCERRLKQYRLKQPYREAAPDR